MPPPRPSAPPPSPRPDRGASRRVAFSAFAALILGAAACDSAAPGPGTLTATVTSPNGAEGAAVVVLSGEGIEGVSAIDGRVFSERRGDSLVVVVVRDAAGTLRFAVQVADTTQKPKATVNEVAGPDDALRAVLGGYSVEVKR